MSFRERLATCKPIKIRKVQPLHDLAQFIDYKRQPQLRARAAYCQLSPIHKRSMRQTHTRNRTQPDVTANSYNGYDELNLNNIDFKQEVASKFHPSMVKRKIAPDEDSDSDPFLE